MACLHMHLDSHNLWELGILIVLFVTMYMYIYVYRCLLSLGQVLLTTVGLRVSVVHRLSLMLPHTCTCTCIQYHSTYMYMLYSH